MKKRILSILLLCCMVLTLLPAPAFAADEETYALPPDTGGLCEHHPEHDEACGYIPKTAEIPQENEVKIAVLSGTQETVTVESVQAMIDALPEAKNINDDNIEEVKIQFQAVVDAMNQLTVREQNELDISRYMKVSSVLYGPWRDFFNPIPGTDIEWMLSSNDDETLTLTIIGQGEMPDFEDADSQACPWTNSKYAIKRVIIREGVTNIGNYAFNRCAKLAEVHISKTVKKIGTAAFLNCSSLTQIDIPDCVNSVGSFAFVGCTGLKEVHTHWKSSDEINFGPFVFYEYGSSWPEDRIIYVPAGYKANFKSNPKGAWGAWNVQGENYTVSFDGGNASGSMEPVQTSGDYTLPDCSFTYETAVFEYWALENSDGKKAGDAGDVFPVTEDVTFYANWRLVIVIDPDPPIEVCIHEWGEWQSDSNEHWKKCSFCNVVDLGSRRAHDYSDDTDATCSICDYERTITPPAPTLEPPSYSRQIYSGDFCQLAFSDEYLSGGTATADGETVDGVFTLNEEQEKYGYWHRGGGLVQVGLLALKVTFTPYDRLRFSTAECTVNVDVIPRKFRQANTSYIDNKKIGTAFEDLGLPNAFYFFAAADEPNHEGSGLNGNVPGIIKWDDSNYDPNSYEEQTIYGTVDRAEFEKYYIVPEGADLRGVVKVTLQADPVETEITQPPVFRWKNGDFTLPDNTMFVNRIFEMGATGGGSAVLADGVAKVKGADTVVPGTFSFKEGTASWFGDLGENVVTVVFTPTDPHSYRKAETTIKINVIKNTLKNTEEPDPITHKPLGTTFAQLGLPQIVVAEAIDGHRVGMTVSWDGSSYDAQSTAWQTIPGTLVFDANDEQTYQQPEPAVTARIRVKLIGPESAPTITTTTLPGGTVGTPYNHQLHANGEGFILWEIISGALPAGLTLKETTGEISGTPTADGTATFTVKATNSVGNDKKELSIAIAKAPAAEHTVTVKTNGRGTASASPAKAAAETEITLTATPNEGYHFKEWQVVSPAGLVITNGKFAMPESNVEIKAIFEKDAPPAPTEYTVTFDGNGGTPSVSSMTTTNQKLTSLPTATRGGRYSFDDWYTKKSGGTKITTDTPFSGDMTVYAHWTYTDSGSSGGSGSTSYTITIRDAKNGSVTANRRSAPAGATVTITVMPHSGYVLETISVTGRNDNGLKLTDKGGGKYTFIMPDSKVEVKATFMEDNSVLTFFYDVPNDAYYYEAVKWAVENGITGGIGNSLFAPDQPCTRAQIVTFLWRAAGSPVVNYAMDTADVAEDAYYAEAVRWALSEGITTGTGDGTFSPDAACTRAQAVAFLFRAAVANGLEAVTLSDLLSGFEDAASVPGYALPAMNWALSQGIVKGSGTQLLPGGACTRAQIVTFLYRAYQSS